MGKELMGMGGRLIIFELIEERFGAVSNDVRRRLERIYDPKRLKRIAGGLLKVKDIKQLKTLIGPNGKSTVKVK
jgi:hypothetical protein